MVGEEGGFVEDEVGGGEMVELGCAAGRRRDLVEGIGGEGLFVVVVEAHCEEDIVEGFLALEPARL